MPQGIILSSASPGASQEAIEKVLSGAGLEVEKPEETPVEFVEPKRDDFETDEEFEAAHVEFEDAQKAADEDDDEEEEETEEEEEPPKRESRGARRFKKRIEKITAPLKTENAELKRRLEALEKGGKKDAPPPDPNPRPKKADFKTDEAYEDALVLWGSKKAAAEKSVEDAAKAEQAQLQKNWDNYKSAADEFKETHDDWDEVVDQGIPMHTSVQLAVMEQENGPAVVYYLGKHPEFAKKLAAMTPLSAVMEVGRLSQKLAAASGSPSPGSGRRENPKPKQKVPPPVKPVNTSATTSSATSKDAAKAKDYKAFKKLQNAGR